MEGVIVLSEEIIYKSGMNWTVFWIVASVIAIIMICYCIFIFITEGAEEGLGCLYGAFIAIALGVMLALLIGALSAEPIAQYTKQKVLIEDNVSMMEFTQHYEILGAEGQIFIVREK